jgi:hypothetical protein
MPPLEQPDRRDPRRVGNGADAVRDCLRLVEIARQFQGQGA